MKSGTLDRELLWKTPTGKQVSIASRRLVSFTSKHVAAISYSIVISSEMRADGRSASVDGSDPRQTRSFSRRVLHPR
jgi:alpha,alpha-trehalose phosphorylase